VTVAELPAASTAVPVTSWPAPSWLSSTGALHEAMPLCASEHSKLTVTSVLFQPAAFGAGSSLATIVGGSASPPVPRIWTVMPLPGLAASSIVSSLETATCTGRSIRLDFWLKSSGPATRTPLSVTVAEETRPYSPPSPPLSICRIQLAPGLETVNERSVLCGCPLLRTKSSGPNTAAVPANPPAGTSPQSRAKAPMRRQQLAMKLDKLRRELELNICSNPPKYAQSLDFLCKYLEVAAQKGRCQEGRSEARLPPDRNFCRSKGFTRQSDHGLFPAGGPRCGKIGQRRFWQPGAPEHASRAGTGRDASAGPAIDLLRCRPRAQEGERQGRHGPALRGECPGARAQAAPPEGRSGPRSGHSRPLCAPHDRPGLSRRDAAS
jgi:hypothetical protein